LQETFLRVWDHRAELASGADGGDRQAVRRYLWRVARNLMIDEIRAKARRRERGHMEVPLTNGERITVKDRYNPDPERQVEHEDCLRVLRETVGRLARGRTRRCLELWLEGKSLTEIAEEADLELGQVRGLLQRGKARVISTATHRLRASGPRGG
jgi:RNA polymerase sigma factor (sigma-70 family)